MQISFKPLTLLAFLFLLFSCSYAQKNNGLSANEFSKALATDQNAQLIDVRTADEFDETHIENAKNIDWNGDDFESEISGLDKTQPVYVYCRSGARSAKAAAKMRKMGFENVYELKGGILAWEQAGLLNPATETDKE